MLFGERVGKFANSCWAMQRGTLPEESDSPGKRAKSCRGVLERCVNQFKQADLKAFPSWCGPRSYSTPCLPCLAPRQTEMIEGPHS